MKNITRKDTISALFASAPKYRLEQIGGALFNPAILSWDDLSMIGKPDRERLKNSLPFISLERHKLLVSKNDGSEKAILKLADGRLIETVLMNNSRGQYTICLSSQVGCAMACRFCATGKMGLLRNLLAEEITDQYRFWLYHLAGKKTEGLITNIVIMGMGEPMANYENIKAGLNEILKYTEIGPTHITVSTIGLFPVLGKMLDDADWPNVRLAISLHAPDLLTREKIIPSSPADYYAELVKWSKLYLKKFGNRSHYLSFEYIMINGLNDSLAMAEKLEKLLKKIGPVKVNLIPCNDALNPDLSRSESEHIRNFSEYLINHGIRSTIRQSQGQDIAAACGQLITQENIKTKKKNLSPINR